MATEEEIMTWMAGYMEDNCFVEAGAPLLPTSRFREDLDFDSISLMDFTINAEKRFQVTVSQYIKQMDTVQDFCNVITGNIAALREPDERRSYKTVKKPWNDVWAIAGLLGNYKEYKNSE